MAETQAGRVRPRIPWSWGDTPKDIACGKSLGAKTLAVATGNFPAEELRMHGPSLVVRCFADSAMLVARLRRYCDNGN